MPKKEKIQKMFDGIAPSYDRLNHIMSLGIDRLWRKRMLRSLSPAIPGKALDVACGTGDSAIELARAGSTVTGADISIGMMDLVMEKAAKAGVSSRISLVVADAEALPFAEGGFDALSCCFGVRNFEHKEMALEEFKRVLRPGGKLAVLELSVPQNIVLGWLYDLYFMHILPWVGGIISGDRAAYRYLPSSVHAFPPPQEFCGMLREAGFASVSHRSLSLGLCRLYTAEVPTL